MNQVRMDRFLQSYAWPLVVTHHYKVTAGPLSTLYMSAEVMVSII